LHAFSGKRLRTSSGTDDSFTNQPWLNFTLPENKIEIIPLRVLSLPF
jgi:hypothetical protein